MQAVREMPKNPDTQRIISKMGTLSAKAFNMADVNQVILLALKWDLFNYIWNFYFSLKVSK
jgi:hypothetical protein